MWASTLGQTGTSTVRPLVLVGFCVRVNHASRQVVVARRCAYITSKSTSARTAGGKVYVITPYKKVDACLVLRRVTGPPAFVSMVEKSGEVARIVNHVKIVQK